MRIGPVDLERDVLVVAEIGNNHEGDLGLATEMVSLAAESGVDAVKFQTIDPIRLVGPSDERRLAQLERFRLSRAEFESLAACAEASGVLFLSTPFDIDCVAWLEPLVAALKVSSGDNDFLPLIERVVQTGKPILLSSGLASLEEMAAARDHVRAIDPAADLAILHCVSSYPTPPEEANLGAILELATLGVTVGYSDHTLGIEASVLAVAAGARVIEKHFTIDKAHSDFRDHRLSADAIEMADLVRRVREANVLFGDGKKFPRSCEEALSVAARRSIVARRDLAAGARVATEDLDWIRPGGGLSPGREGEVVGRILGRALRRGEAIRLEDLS